MPWLKWTDGETKRVKIVSAEPVQKLIHWVGGRSLDCHGSLCQVCKMGDRPSVRWSVETYESGQGMTWEMANMVWLNLLAIAENQKGLAGLILDVVRKGTGRETRYTLIPVGKEPVAASERVEEDDQCAVDVPPPSFDEQLAAGTLPSIPSRSGGQVAEERVRRDAQGAAEYCKDLCKRLDEDPRVALGIFLAGGGKAYAESNTATKLGAFIKYQELRVEAAEKVERETEPELDLDVLLA